MKRLTLLCLTAILVILTACMRQETKKSLAVSIPPQKWLLEQIVGDRYNIVTLLTPDSDPEHYDPQIATLSALQHSKIFFRVGTIGFEQASLEKISDNFPDMKIVDTSKGITILEGTHPGPHGSDPHIWTSVANARIMAKIMYDELVAMEPEQKKFYTKNYEALLEKLDKLDKDIRTKLAGSQGSAFVVFHPSLSYFAHDYGLRQVALEVGGKEVSPRQLRKNQDEARQADAKVLIIEEGRGAKSAQNTASHLNLPVREVSLLGYDWDQTMLKVADAIANN